LLNPQQAAQAGLVSFFEKHGFGPEPLVVYLKKL
jgi:preprotein translocase subunit Sec61beta